jgi:selenocysteine-specific elongation factor
MIVGTAGHIDHGKTTLVRALTGVDTDRLKEEKARGISIELGYAYTPLDDGDVLGFIDVPGHERFVHKMVAGACGIDFALLLVAADDGVMPQTREHLAILELLGIARGAVALSKADRVDGTGCRKCRLRSPQRSLPRHCMRCADLSPECHGRTIRVLHLCAAICTNRRPFPLRRDERLFRLAVDRVFTLAGHGTVVTGTVFSGQVRTNDTVAVMPAGTLVRVRSIHTQNRAADSGSIGQRCALNLAGVKKSALARGDWLAEPRVFAPTTRIDVRLQLLAVSGLRLNSWSPLHVHLGTTHHVAHVAPLGSALCRPASPQACNWSLTLRSVPIPGDRFIVRDAQATHTVGGGVVLDPPRRPESDALRHANALSRRARAADRRRRCRRVTAAGAKYGVKITELVRLTGLPPELIPLPADAVTIDCAPRAFRAAPARIGRHCASVP